MLIATSTQLLSGPSPGPDDAHPFMDAAMVQVTRKFFTFMFLTFQKPANFSYSFAGKFFSYFGCSQVTPKLHHKAKLSDQWFIIQHIFRSKSAWCPTESGLSGWCVKFTS